MNLETMYCDLRGRVATIVLNRPHVLNCANAQWARDFHTIVDDLAGREELRVIVLRAAGRAFCSGVDLTGLANGDVGMEFFRSWELALRKLEMLDPLVIAAIQSHCIGGGLQLALACDFRLAREDARFGVTAVKEGIVPGMGMWRIARYAGLGRAKRLALAAEVIDAHTAEQWGLVDYVKTADAFEAGIDELTARVLEMAWTSTRLTKQLIQASHDVPFAEFVDLFCDSQRLATSSPEHRAAMEERRAQRRQRHVGGPA